MADIVVPTLGESVTEARVAKWLKKKGDSVDADEAVVELETDKVNLEVNAPESGVLSEIVAEEDTDVEVGAVLGRIGDAAGEAAAPAKAKSEEKSEAKGETKGETKAESKAETKSEPKPDAKAEKEAPAKAEGGEPLEIAVPTLGESVSEATVARWLKQEGEAVAADEAVAELETDKVTLEVNAPKDGVLSEIKAGEGETVEVGAVLAVMHAGAAPSAKGKPAAKGGERAEEKPAPEAEAKPAPEGDGAETPAGDAADRLRPETVKRSGEGGRITEQDLLDFLEEQSLGRLGPAVRKLVSEKGLDPGRIPATGKDGRLTKQDVIDFLEGRTKPLEPAKAPPSSAPPSAPPSDPSSGRAAKEEARAPEAREERVRMTKLRQTIARRLKEAQNTAAMLTTFNEIDMSRVMALRKQYRETFEKKHGVRLGFTSFFTKAAVAALKEIPEVNAHIDGEEIVYKRYYAIGMAVSTPNGLMVPVVRECDRKSFAEIEKSLGDLAARGRDGKLSMEDITGGTFTITNGGVFGSLLSTPILNMPQSAILGLHKIEERAVIVDGEIVARPMMYVALSYDHRIIDGREAVTFLVRIKEHIEDPDRLLLDV